MQRRVVSRQIRSTKLGEYQCHGDFEPDELFSSDFMETKQVNNIVII